MPAEPIHCGGMIATTPVPPAAAATSPRARALHVAEFTLAFDAQHLYALRQPAADVSIVDAYHAALMADIGLTEIYSFDPHFDRAPGITRLEP